MGKHKQTDEHNAGAPLILVADGSATHRDTIVGALKKQGFRTLVAENGSAALILLRVEQPDLLLVDQDMPGLSGIDLLRELRGNLNGGTLPAIIMTAMETPKAVIAALDAGADDHLVTPVDHGVLRARIDRLLERSREVGALRQAAAALDARLIRRSLEIEELLTRIDTLLAEKAALSTLLSSRDLDRQAGLAKSGVKPAIKSIAAT